MQEQMQEIITRIVGIALQEEVVHVEQILEKGIVNLVFKITVGNGMYILRMQKGEDALKAYKKEKWCMEAVSELGIPSPFCIALGIEGGYSYSIQTYIQGLNGRELPEEKERIWFTLGQYAKKIHTIPASEYVVNLPWLNHYLFEDGFLSQNNLISDNTLEQIQKRIREMETWDFTPMLAHGNLEPNNTVVHPSGTVYLIDWGTASGGKVPHGDLAELYTWNTGKENIQAFMKGYGMNEDELLVMMRDIQTLVLVRLLTTMRWKIERKENWQEDEFITSTAHALKKIVNFDTDILFTKNL